MIKKFIKTGVFAVVLAAAPMYLTSCSDDDDDEDAQATYNARTEKLADVIEDYLDDVVYPTYTNLANATTELYAALVGVEDSFNDGTLTQSEIDDACEIFLEARAWWELSEAWLYGPADVLGIDPHIDSWPLDVEALSQILSDEDALEKLYDNDVEVAIKYISEENNEASHLGFHGVEYILFRDGANRQLATLSQDETDGDFADLGVGGKEELAFAVAVAGDLRDWTSLLEYSWYGSATASAHIARVTARSFDYILEGMDTFFGQELIERNSNDYGTERAVIIAMLNDGCSNICAEVADQKMGQPYRAAVGQPAEDDEDGLGYIESPYSHNSFTDFYNNITSIKNALYGNIGGSSPASNSIMAYLQSENADLAEELQDELDDALEALKACVNYNAAFVEIVNNTSTYSAGMTLVEEAMEEVTELDEELQYVASWIRSN